MRFLHNISSSIKIYVNFKNYHLGDEVIEEQLRIPRCGTPCMNCGVKLQAGLLHGYAVYDDTLLSSIWTLHLSYMPICHRTIEIIVKPPFTNGWQLESAVSSHHSLFYLFFHFFFVLGRVSSIRGHRAVFHGIQSAVRMHKSLGSSWIRSVISYTDQL